MINNLINKLVSKFKKYNIDGYIIPKNDEFFQNILQMIGLKLSQTFLAPLVIQSFLKRKTIYLLMGDTLYKQKKKRAKIFKL